MSQVPPPPIQKFEQKPVGPPQNQGLSAGKILLIVFGVFAMMIFVLVLALLPAVFQIRNTASRAVAADHARQIMISMHHYHDAFKQLPDPYTEGENGMPLHSWRTQLLPFLEETPLYDRIDQQKPWNDPSNREFTETKVDKFSSPRCSDSVGTTLTAFVAIVGEDSVIRKGKVSFRSIVDGMSRTAVILELPKSEIHWAEPRDITVDEAIEIIKNHNVPGGLNVGFADASVFAITSDVSEESLRKMFGCNDGADEILY